MLEPLLNYVPKKSPVVSLYLNADMTKRLKEEVMLVLKGFLKEASEKADPEDLRKIEDFFSLEYDWQAKGVALFSCAEGDLWLVYSFPKPFNDEIQVLPEPYIRPLVHLLSSHERYSIILVSREQARFFSFQMGKLEELGGVSGTIPGKHKQGGWAQARYQRHIDELAAQQLKNAAENFAKLWDKEKFSYVIIGGTEENVKTFTDFLPGPIQEAIATTFTTDIMVPIPELEEEVVNLIEGFEKSRNEELVRQILTEAAKGRKATSGLDDTLNAIREGRVNILLLDPEFKASGKKCPNCGYMSSQRIEICPVCSSALEERPDILNDALAETLRKGGKIVTLSGNQELAKAGYIASLLRY